MILGTMTGANILQAKSELNVTARILKDMNLQLLKTVEEFALHMIEMDKE